MTKAERIVCVGFMLGHIACDGARSSAAMVDPLRPASGGMEPGACPKAPEPAPREVRWVGVAGPRANGVAHLPEGTASVRFALPASERQRLGVGDAVIFETSDDGREFPAAVSRVDPEVDPLIDLVIAEATLQSSSRELPESGAGGVVMTAPASPAAGAAGRMSP